MRIWVDITNTPHVHVLLPIIKHLGKKHEIIVSARDFSETLPLLKTHGINPIVCGEYKGKARVFKVAGLLTRLLTLSSQIPPFDISISLGGNYTATLSWIRRKPSIVFSDNDISYKGLAFKFGTDFIFPSYFDSGNLLKKRRISLDQIHTFEGFKEDIYIADFVPDPNFNKMLPFKEFITIRPENLKASYVSSDSLSIVPELFKRFERENILFLPRYLEERDYAIGYNNIYLPDAPLSGLDVCYNTKAMLTGAGTFAREAALLGTPAVSFFPGNHLAVDKEMIKRNWEFKSRDPDEIFNYVIAAKKRETTTEESKTVKNNVIQILDNILK